MEILGYILALLVGLSLGLIGGGGSILTVPIMVYVIGIEPVLATAYSLFVVGSSAIVGAYKNYKRGLVSLKTAIIFAIPSLITVYLTRKFLLPSIPENIVSLGGFTLSKSLAVMIFFAIVMVVAAILMLRKKKNQNDDTIYPLEVRYNLPMIALQGGGIGLLAGLVGAGGGFLIVPALVLLVKLPMKSAVGTSLTVISINSLVGVVGDLQAGSQFDWTFLLLFSAFSVGGIFLGTYLATFISGQKLKRGFGWFVLVMAITILTKELLEFI